MRYCLLRTEGQHELMSPFRPQASPAPPLPPSLTPARPELLVHPQGPSLPPQSQAKATGH